MEHIWIDNPETLEAFCREELASADEVGVDTESDQFHAYNSVTCLVQVSSRSACALVDTLAMSHEEMMPLWDIFSDESIEKILHSAANDLNVLDRDYGVSFQNVFDTQIAAKFLRYERDSLAFLLDLLYDVKASKKYQKFDWKTRPLPPEPAQYAAEDVIYLHSMRDHFKRLLEEDGWYEPFLQQCDYMVRKTTYTPIDFDPDGWRRLKYPNNFTGKQRAMLKAIHIWRHELCTELNMATFHILPNHQVVKIAALNPRSAKQIEQRIHGLKSSVRHRLKSLQAAIDASRDDEVPPKKAPRKPREYPRPTDEEEDRYQALRAWRNEIAESEDLTFELIANNATLRELARLNPTTMAELEATGELLPWQLNDFGQSILERLGP